jgi:Skp family chaperone for outer membrane proteins
MLGGVNMATSLDVAARKRRLEELEAKRREIQAEMSKVQRTGRLSELNARLAEIVQEIKQLHQSITTGF